MTQLRLAAASDSQGGAPLWPLTAAACLLGGIHALLAGQSADWDLRNYHFYNGWLLLHGLLDRDLLMAQIPSFFNPLLDLPFAWMAENLPARAVGFVLGAVHGLNFAPLMCLGRCLLDLPEPRRSWAAASLAGIGIAGAGGLSELGTTFGDNVVSLGVLSSAALVACRWHGLDFRRALAAGIPVGLAMGLKLPAGLFAAGMVLALAARPRLAMGLGLGAVLGLLAADGWWMARLWQLYGNPVFPFFNHIFQSPWALPQSNRDPAYVPESLWEAVAVAFGFPFQPRLVGEVRFLDFRLPALMLLAPLGLARAGALRWLMAFALISAVLWVGMFAIYRYAIALEMLAPILCAAALRARRAAAWLVAGLLLTTHPGDWLRIPWQERAVSAQIPPVPPHSLVLAAGHEPLSFLVPLFPRDVRFLRIDSTFTLPERGFRDLFRAAIAQPPGPILALFLDREAADAAAKLAEYGLAQGECQPITSPLGGPYSLCATTPVGRGRDRTGDGAGG